MARSDREDEPGLDTRGRDRDRDARLSDDEDRLSDGRGARYGDGGRVHEVGHDPPARP